MNQLLTYTNYLPNQRSVHPLVERRFLLLIPVWTEIGERLLLLAFLKCFESRPVFQVGMPKQFVEVVGHNIRVWGVVWSGPSGIEVFLLVATSYPNAVNQPDVVYEDFIHVCRVFVILFKFFALTVKGRLSMSRCWHPKEGSPRLPLRSPHIRWLDLGQRTPPDPL